MVVPDEWTTQLADAIAAAVREYAPRLQGAEVALLTVTCLPWHGALSLAVLTAEELDADPGLANPRTTMDWQHGELVEEIESWGRTTPLAQEMRAAYYDSTDRPAAAVEFLRACARAAASPAVAEAMGLFPRAGGFWISVPHPDDGREYFPPATDPGTSSGSSVE
jgi:hypothetical protein